MYRFIQFTQPLEYRKAVEALKTKHYYPCDLRQMLIALSLFDQNKIKLPLETQGGNTRGDIVVLDQTTDEGSNVWVPGAQVSYHEVDNWKLLLARSWEQLMEQKWQGHWHVLVRMTGARKLLQEFLLHQRALSA